MIYLYRLFHGLIYPAILGAAIIWIVQYCLQARPSPWIAFFGIWFIFYHASLFMRFKDRRGNDYTYGDAITDLTEAASVIIGYYGLGLMTSTPSSGQPYSYTLVYIAALMVPIVGTITNVSIRKVKPRLLAIPAALFPGAGLYGCLSHEVTLWFLWGVLAAYLYCVFKGDSTNCWFCKGGR